MSGPNPSELGKSQNQENPITRSQVKKNTELAQIVAQNQTGPLKPKRTVTVKEKSIRPSKKCVSVTMIIREYLYVGKRERTFLCS